MKLREYIASPEFEADFKEYELGLVLDFAHVPYESLGKAHARLVAARDFKQHIMETYNVKA